jgi:hypothetical protein
MCQVRGGEVIQKSRSLATKMTILMKEEVHKRLQAAGYGFPSLRVRCVPRDRALANGCGRAYVTVLGELARSA